MRRSEIARRLAASLATPAAGIGLVAVATFGSFNGTDPFPHSVRFPADGYR